MTSDGNPYARFRRALEIGNPDLVRAMLSYMIRQSLLRAWGEFQEEHPLIVAPIFTDVPFEAGKPNCIIAHTHKGQGVSFMRDKAAWHHRIPKAEELARALKELEEVTS